MTEVAWRGMRGVVCLAWYVWRGVCVFVRVVSLVYGVVYVEQ